MIHSHMKLQCCTLLLRLVPSCSVSIAATPLYFNKVPDIHTVHGIPLCRLLTFECVLRQSLAELLECGTADKETGTAVLTAARRWLVRNGADIKRVSGTKPAPALACMRLVACLPALEDVRLTLPGLPVGNNLNCLLEVLASCPCLADLRLYMESEDKGSAPFPKAPAFAKLRSLRMLHLGLRAVAPSVLADVAHALAPLTGLAHLSIDMYEPAVLPAALGQLKGLLTLEFMGLKPCTFEAGCLDLPNLLWLRFSFCRFEGGEVLPGVSALQSLTIIELVDNQGLSFINPQLTQLPRLQQIVFSNMVFPRDGAYPWLSRPAADMGTLRLGLLHLDLSGNGLTHFPLALTQLVALECLRAGGNEFEQLPAAITALSGLTELALGRFTPWEDRLQLHEKRPLDARALGDLSAFPALRDLRFQCCEVMVCASRLGAVRHPSLACLLFDTAHPAPECALLVLQLSQALKRLGRGSVLVVYNSFTALAQREQAPPPINKFMAALEAFAP